MTQNQGSNDTRRTMTADEVDASSWITTEAVAQRLGVKKETVYAYVSRGLLTADRVGRQSRFKLSEVDALAQRTGADQSDAGFSTAIFSRDDGRLTYRDRPVAQLATRERFESVAELLWDADARPEVAEWPGPDPEACDTVRRALNTLPDDVLVSDKFKTGVALLGALDGPGSSYHVPEVATSGRRLLMSLAETLPDPAGGAGKRAASDTRLAHRLWTGLTTHPADDEHVGLLDTALILSAEHGLAPSTTVARTAASLGATLYGVLSAGMGAGTNDVYGSSALIVEDMLRGLESPPRSLRALADQARIQGRLPGFGHHLYPEGDLRAQLLLNRLQTVAPDNPRLAQVWTLSRVMDERGLPPPNLYLALATMAYSFEMPRGATEAIFALGRSAGWIAHAIEEYRKRPLQAPRPQRPV